MAPFPNTKKNIYEIFSLCVVNVFMSFKQLISLTLQKAKKK